MKTKLIDKALGTGVFEGDLKFGRCMGNILSKHGDVDAGRQDGIPTNQPIAPLVLVQRRDPHVWKKNPAIKIVKSNLNPSQHSVNYILKSFRENKSSSNMNIKLVVGRQRW